MFYFGKKSRENLLSLLKCFSLWTNNKYIAYLFIELHMKFVCVVITFSNANGALSETLREKCIHSLNINGDCHQYSILLVWVTSISKGMDSFLV